VLKFLAPPRVHDERAQLLPVLQTILHLDSAELELVRKSCAVAAQQQQQQLDEQMGTTAAEGGHGQLGKNHTIIKENENILYYNNLNFRLIICCEHRRQWHRDGKQPGGLVLAFWMEMMEMSR